MALRYPPHNYDQFPSHQWSDESKSAFSEHEDPNALEGKVMDSTAPVNMPLLSNSRRTSMIKVEDEYSSSRQAWHDGATHHMPGHPRLYSHHAIPMIDTSTNSYGRMSEPHFGHSYVTQPQWPLSAHSGTSTPTPVYCAIPDGFNQPVQYHNAPLSYTGFAPDSAVSMSPQSSQGGWGSAASSDSMEQHASMRSPAYRPPSPGSVLRPDGVRKKNARFEIPKERNLANIDAMIMASTDDIEKKELKQQKRLLRNRQAALDSRQRKKTHTERLEQEKKIYTSQKAELEDTLTQVESSLQQERDAWLLQRQQYEQYIQSLQYERDEAIRTKTLETAELRRRNNMLMDMIRDLERQHQVRSSSATHDSEHFSNDFEFNSLGLDDSWEDEFSLINNDELKMDDQDMLQRQATPRPTTTATPKVDQVDGSFSWNTFYMCLLFGAFIASSGNNPVTSHDTSNAVTSTLPTLSEDYRAEAGNVLKAVLSSSPDTAHEVLPIRARSSNLDTTPSSSRPALGQASSTLRPSSLDMLHDHLSTPSFEQDAADAFSLSASSYAHITNPDGLLDDDDNVEYKPSRLEQAFAELQAQRSEMDRLAGLGGKAAERSILLERVPEKVLKDFRELVGMSEKMKQQD